MPPNAQRDRSQLSHTEIVLVSPRNPLNIGAAARAMANFGFARLTLVAPYEPHWREAKSAVGANDLLQNAKTTQSLAAAVADCTLVFGAASPSSRQPEQPLLSLPALAPLVRHELARGGRVALVFGPEKRGLTRKDLSTCHRLLVIPTHPRQPSMNLGQAVAVCLYELATRLDAAAPSHLRTWEDKSSEQPRAGAPDLDSETRITTTVNEPSASSAHLGRLADVVEETMQAAGYSPAAMRAANRHDLDLLLRRLDLSAPDATRMLGLFRRILWRLRH